MSRRLIGALTAIAVVVAAVAGIGLMRAREPEQKTVTATFQRTTSLYEGAKVKVLGVTVGRVESIEVEGDAVEVTMSYDAEVTLPADAHALIVPPSIVGDRFVQLAPAYESGPVLEDGATIALDRTGVPLELDDNYRALDELARGLGPEGANADGALSRLVRATARNLGGRGRMFNQAVREMSLAISTLADGSGDANATIDNLARITRTLAGKDREMRRLITNVALIATELNGQRRGITRAVGLLRSALDDVARLGEEQGEELTATVDDLTAVTGILDRHSATLASAIRLAPVGLTSMGNIYVPKNWDPSKPWETPVAGRTGSLALHAPLLQDLDVQLGYALNTMCSSLTPEQQEQLGGLCAALQQAGGDLGALLTQLGTGGAAPELDDLSDLLQGGQQ